MPNMISPPFCVRGTQISIIQTTGESTQTNVVTLGNMLFKKIGKLICDLLYQGSNKSQISFSHLNLKCTNSADKDFEEHLLDPS